MLGPLHESMSGPDLEIWYLGSPYIDPDPEVRQYRCDVVTLVAGNLFQNGHKNYSPIAMCHPITLASDLPKDFSYWQDFDFAMIERLSGLMVTCISGWKESNGLQSEIDFACSLSRPIKYVTVTGIFASGNLVDVATRVLDEPPNERSLHRATL